MKSPYRCLYNHELLILFTTETPYQRYDLPVDDNQVVGYVRELGGTGVDALMICPQVWQTNLWMSNIDPRWQTYANDDKVPSLQADLKYYEKAYFRAREYMLQGKDPVALTIKTARESGIAPLFSYRMNEHHYTHRDSPTHSLFWRQHPEMRLHGKITNLNYLEPAVRQYHQSLIFELLDLYDVDGFECDFMRYPAYFPEDRIGEGMDIMTQFVTELRKKLDAVGASRQKRMFLSVRVPRNPKKSMETGLNVKEWHDRGLVDMINVSPFFRITPEIDIEGYRTFATNASVYGEMHVMSQAGRAPGGYNNNINRKTNPELYRSTALNFLDRGADGISLFNFSYSREHSFNEPRRKYFPGVEPPFHVISSLTSAERLRRGDQHFVITPGFGTLPRVLNGNSKSDFSIYIPDCFNEPFSSGVLRIEATTPITHLPLDVLLNQERLNSFTCDGELFQAISLEGLPDEINLKYFRLPTHYLRTGINEISIQKHETLSDGGHPAYIEISRIEIALYRSETSGRISSLLDESFRGTANE